MPPILLLASARGPWSRCGRRSAPLPDERVHQPQWGSPRQGRLGRVLLVGHQPQAQRLAGLLEHAAAAVPLQGCPRGRAGHPAPMGRPGGLGLVHLEQVVQPAEGWDQARLLAAHGHAAGEPSLERDLLPQVRVVVGRRSRYRRRSGLRPGVGPARRRRAPPRAGPGRDGGRESAVRPSAGDGSTRPKAAPARRSAERRPVLEGRGGSQGGGGDGMKALPARRRSCSCYPTCRKDEPARWHHTCGDPVRGLYGRARREPVHEPGGASAVPRA